MFKLDLIYITNFVGLPNLDVEFIALESLKSDPKRAMLFNDKTKDRVFNFVKIGHASHTIERVPVLEIRVPSTPGGNPNHGEIVQIAAPGDYVVEESFERGEYYVFSERQFAEKYIYWAEIAGFWGDR